MGIFNEPKRLGLLLASVKVNYEERPLTPIQAAEWIQEAIEELGGKDKVMERLDLSSSMINAFQNLLTKVSEDITSSFKWGKTDAKNGVLNFTAAHLMSSFEPEEQNKLFSACFELAQKGTKFPGKEELKRVKQYYNENKDVSFDDAIAYIFKMDRPLPQKLLVLHFIGVKELRQEAVLLLCMEAVPNYNLKIVYLIATGS